jgi:hypothetical protein
MTHQGGKADKAVHAISIQQRWWFVYIRGYTISSKLTNWMMQAMRRGPNHFDPLSYFP